MSATVIIGGRPIGETGTPRVIASTLYYSADDAGGIVGSSLATFTMVAGPRDPLPALTVFTAVQIEVDAMRVWSGFVWVASRTGRLVSVECHGTKEHLQNDLISLAPMETRLDEWEDAEPYNTGSFYDAPPLGWVDGSSLVAVSAGTLALTFPATPASSTLSNLSAVVALYTGMPFPAQQCVVVVFFSGSVGGRFRVWSTNSLPGQYARADAIDVPDTVPGGVYAAAMAPGELVKVGWGWTGSTSVAASQTATIVLLWLFDRAAYCSGTASVLRGSDVAHRVRALTPALSSDESQIVATPTILQHATWPPPGVAPSAVLAEAASYDDPLLAVDAYDRLVFKPRSLVPALEMSGLPVPPSESPDDPTAAVSGVVVSGANPSGLPVSTRYSPLDLPEQPRILSPNVGVPNGGFPADVSSWVCSATSKLVWDASSGPTGGPFASWQGISGGPIAPGDYVYVPLTGTFRANTPYLLEFWAAESTAAPAWKASLSAPTLTVWLYDSADVPGLARCVIRLAAGAWEIYTLTWVPRQDTSSGFLILNNITSDAVTYPDGRSAYVSLNPAIALAALYELATPGPLVANRVARVGQVSVPVIASPWISLALGISYMRSNALQGYTGVYGAADGDCRDASSHAPLAAAGLTSKVGQIARVGGRVDPVDGKAGAHAYVSGVTCTHATRSAQITLGQRYGAYEQLLALTGAATSGG